MTEGQPAIRELSARCAAPTSLWLLLPQRLAGSTGSPLLSPGVSSPRGGVGSAWGGRGSAPGCPFTCDDQPDLTCHLYTQPPACPKRDPSLPHRTANLCQKEARLRLFSDPTGHCFPPSPEPPLSCVVFSVGLSGQKGDQEEHLAQLQPAPTARSPSGRYSLLARGVQGHTPVVLSYVHAQGSVNRASKGIEIHTTLVLLSQASQKDGMAGLARDMTAPPQREDFPHRTCHAIVFSLVALLFPSR